MTDPDSFTLVIQAHPREDSLSKALLDEVVSQLQQLDQRWSVLRVGHGDHLTEASLTDVKALIVIAPTWWGAMPAVLLNELQVLLSPWVDGDRKASTSPFRDIARLVVVTTHGSSKTVNVLQGEPGKVLWERTVLPLCAPKAIFDWISLYRIDQVDEHDVLAFISDAGQRAIGQPITNQPGDG